MNTRSYFSPYAQSAWFKMPIGIEVLHTSRNNEDAKLRSGDHVYIGMDVSFYLSGWDHSWLSGVIRQCHKKDANTDAVKFHPFFNAGVLGGTRHVLLAILYQLTRYFDHSPHHMNCNMGTMTVVGHKQLMIVFILDATRPGN